ncbi:hypothetical protein ACH4VR_36175 [Streptomyces sp. NPDC020883]|uniref:hypothetical protein n=1 Tax=Streptomyces sp. NPDC020883 TaxID=3365099 RepID=UPI00378FABEE
MIAGGAHAEPDGLQPGGEGIRWAGNGGVVNHDVDYSRQRGVEYSREAGWSGHVPPKELTLKVNLTPHSLNVYDKTGERLIETLPGQGNVRTLESKEIPTGDVEGLPTGDFHFEKEVIGLPEPAEGTVYVVSLVAALGLMAAGIARDDVYVPGGLVRDEKGGIVGCKGIRRLLARPV